MKIRNLTFLLVILIALALPAILVQAQQSQPSPTPQTQPFSNDDKAKAQEKMRELGQLFGVTPSPSPGASPAGSPEGKTMADVADKALDKVSDAVGQISQQVQNVAPHIWRIMIKQQYAKALSILIAPWGLFLITLIFAKFMNRYWKFDKTQAVFSDVTGEFLTERGLGGIIRTFIPFLLGLVFSIWGVIAASNAVPMIINPEYYAVQDLLRMLLNPGSIGS